MKRDIHVNDLFFFFFFFDKKNQQRMTQFAVGGPSYVKSPTHLLLRSHGAHDLGYGRQSVSHSLTPSINALLPHKTNK
jgi:hypothetical protein